MKKWQKRKLRDEILALIVLVIGVVIFITSWNDLCPWIAWVGAFIAFAGLCIFIDVRNTNYKKKYSGKAH